MYFVEINLFLKNNFSLICDELKTKLNGNHITNFTFISLDCVVLSFSYNRNEDLLINLKNNNPYIGLFKKEKNVSNLDKDIAFKFRHFIKDSYIVDMKRLNNDQIIVFNLSKKVDEYDYKKYHLVIELIFNKTNLILCDEKYTVLLLLKNENILSKRALLINQTYSLPSNNNIKNINYEISPIDYKNYAMTLYYEAIKKRKYDKFNRLYNFITHKIKILNKKVPIIKEEIENGKKDLIYQELGNACYYLNKDEIEKMFLDYNKKYDETLPLTKLANKCFVSYKKAKSKIENANIQLQKAKEDITYYNNLLSQFENGDEEDLLQMQSYLIKDVSLTRNEKQIIKKINPYQIKVRDNKILFGKNDLQNDYLTFHIAKDNDMFFHIHNYPGAHVIVKGEIQDDNIKNIAAQICLILSKKTAAEVVYTTKKYVKKGTKLGQVILKKFQIAKIDDIAPSTYQLYKNATKN